ncbi:MAG: hypothetical protein UU89_C0023G0022 [Parcubacteria group bacterium GW2011_GWC2_42_11]|nr:MAG: hypothetical protein UU89_C0023G0022 [Parcubacteria group bacterium GW2011_GWC2_42_11]
MCGRPRTRGRFETLRKYARDSGTSPFGLTERVNLNVHNKQLHYVTNGTMNLLPQARKVGLSGFI